jgi:uncharacterized protein YkwD
MTLSRPFTSFRLRRLGAGLPRLALIVAWLASLLSFGAVFPMPADASADEVARVIALTNAERQKAGLQPLVANSSLNAAADGYAVVLASGDCWAHTCGPEPDFAKRAQNAGYTNYSSLAENIAAGYSTPEDVVKGWMNSEGHRKNILNPAFNEIGVGVARGGKMRIYWAQEFGARRGVTPQAPAQPTTAPTPRPTQTPRAQPSPTRTPAATPAPPAPAAAAPAIEALAAVPTPEPAPEAAPAPSPDAAPAEAPAEASPAVDEAALAASLGMNVLELQTLNLINLDRLSRGIHPLIWDAQLADVARAHATDMMNAGFIGHTGSDGSTPLERMRRAGVRVNWGGENVWTYHGRIPHEGPPTMHKAMMDEPHEPGLWNHIANILLPTYRRVGIGVIVDSRGVQYLVENFAD